MQSQMKCRTLWDCYFWCLDWGLLMWWTRAQCLTTIVRALSVRVSSSLEEGMSSVKRSIPILVFNDWRFTTRCYPRVVEVLALGCDELLEMKKRQDSSLCTIPNSQVPTVKSIYYIETKKRKYPAKNPNHCPIPCCNIHTPR